jgi:3-hydroxyisobutyrate dehydrogenase
MEEIMPQKIAFLGLGTMGSPMAQNLVKAGFSVMGWNRTQVDRPLVEQARQTGVTIVATIQAAVEDADIICTCVSDVPDVEQVMFNGVDNIANHGRAGAIVMDFSTIGPQAAQNIAQRLQQSGLDFIDAPVSGGDIGAQNGTLTIMVGGDRRHYETSLPILQAMGKNIIHCGEVGTGQSIKLCNQVLCAIHMVALCEAIELAKTCNIDPSLMVQVCSTGAAGSWALSNLGPKIIAADLAPGFMIKHILKDLRLVQENLGELELPGLSLADRLFNIVQHLGNGDQGTQAMSLAYTESWLKSN